MPLRPEEDLQGPSPRRRNKGNSAPHFPYPSHTNPTQNRRRMEKKKEQTKPSNRPHQLICQSTNTPCIRLPTQCSSSLTSTSSAPHHDTSYFLHSSLDRFDSLSRYQTCVRLLSLWDDGREGKEGRGEMASYGE